MALTHLEFADVTSAGVIDACRNVSSLAYVSFAGRSSAMSVAARLDGWQGPVGLWISVDSSYPASIAARDVKTLSWLIRATDVVVASLDGHSRDHADVLRALLTNEVVNLDNDVATLTNAYNRPAPPEAIEVHWSDGESVSSLSGEKWLLSASRSGNSVTIREFR